MFETMYEAPGIGLAATQVDHHIQLIVMDCLNIKINLWCSLTPKLPHLLKKLSL
jgi:peptide deformylase